MNLLEKLRLKSKASEKHPVIKHKKALLTIATSVGLALTIAFSAFAGVGCKKTPTTVDPTNPNNPTITDPNNPDPTKPNPSDPTDPDYSNYSKLVQNILKSDYYNGLIAQYQGAIRDTSPLFDPHPYAFLERQGHDVDAVKRGDLECRTYSYIKETEPTNLYMITYVENAGATPYYTEYMLKYNLSEQEAEDYDYLYGSSSSIALQSVFLNDEISKTKTPTIVSKTNMSVDAHKGMLEHVKQNDKVTNETIGTNLVDIMLKDYSVENQTFSIYVYERYYSTNNAKTKTKIGVLPCKVGLTNIKESDGVYMRPLNDYRIVSLDDYKNSVNNITLYAIQNMYLDINRVYDIKNLNTKSLEI